MARPKPNPLEILFNPQGRLSRGNFWLYTLVVAIGVFVLAALITAMGNEFGQDDISGLVILPAFWIAIAMGVKRLRDVGKSGWFLLLTIIPCISLYILYLYLQPGDPEPNRYGLPPDALGATTDASISAPALAVAQEPEPGGVTERLQELDRLREAGVITAEEYAAQRARIIEGM